MKTKNMPETIKKELLESILKAFEEENYLQICEEAKNPKDFKDYIFLVKKYEGLSSKIYRREDLHGFEDWLNCVNKKVITRIIFKLMTQPSV